MSDRRKLEGSDPSSLSPKTQAIGQKSPTTLVGSGRKPLGSPNPQAKNSPDKEKPRTQALDDFVVKHLLGKGAFGEVYLAYHKRTERYMAMKQMDKSLIRMQGKIQHIMNEKEILCYTKSPFLVRMHYSFQTKECLYLTMEYCSGGDLRHFLDAVGSLEEEECALFFAEMIMAVHDLHKMGYLHRDIKPENFLIDPKGHLKLADFGLSKQMIGVEEDTPPVTPYQNQSEISIEEWQSRRHRLSLLPGQDCTLRVDQSNVGKLFRKTVRLPGSNILESMWNKEKQDDQTAAWLRRPSVMEKSGGKVRSINPKGLSQANDEPMTIAQAKKDYRRNVAYSVVGSPAYMSPEVTSGLQEAGNQTGYGTEVDWWSLGCVFWEMILGTPPIQGDTPSEIFDGISNWNNILPALLEQYKCYMSIECFDLLSGFLCDAKVRRGTDLNYFKQHAFFKKNSILDWDNLTNYTPPFDPQPLNLEED